MNAKRLEKLKVAVRIGGKGSVRRKKKYGYKRSAFNDKKIKAALIALDSRQINGIDEVNMFKSDGTVLHFNNPHVQNANSSNMFVITGSPEIIPDNLNQISTENEDTLVQILREQLTIDDDLAQKKISAESVVGQNEDDKKEKYGNAGEPNIFGKMLDKKDLGINSIQANSYSGKKHLDFGMNNEREEEYLLQYIISSGDGNWLNACGPNKQIISSVTKPSKEEKGLDPFCCITQDGNLENAKSDLCCGLDQNMEGQLLPGDAEIDTDAEFNWKYPEGHDENGPIINVHSEDVATDMIGSFNEAMLVQDETRAHVKMDEAAWRKTGAIPKYFGRNMPRNYSSSDEDKKKGKKYEDAKTTKNIQKYKKTSVPERVEDHSNQRELMDLFKKPKVNPKCGKSQEETFKPKSTPYRGTWLEEFTAELPELMYNIQKIQDTLAAMDNNENVTDMDHKIDPEKKTKKSE